MSVPFVIFHSHTKYIVMLFLKHSGDRRQENYLASVVCEHFYLIDMAENFKFFKKSILGQLLLTSTMVTSGAIVNFCQLLLHILVKPFSRRIFHNLMYYVNYAWLSSMKNVKIDNRLKLIITLNRRLCIHN